MAKLLIVDDESALRHLLALLFQEIPGCETHQASGALEALERVQRESFDLIVSDFCMPDGSGLDLLNGLRRLEKTTPVILFSGSPRELLEPVLNLPITIIPKLEVDDLMASVRQRLG